MRPITLIKSSYKKILFIISGLMFFSIITFIFLNIIMLNSSEIYPNIYIESVDVGGLTLDEAKDKVKKTFEKELKAFNLDLIYHDKIWNTSYEDIGLYYVFDDYISKAYGIGRYGNYYQRMKKVNSLKKDPQVIKLQPYYDLNKIDILVELISQEINKEPVNAKIERKDGNFIITEEVLGIKVKEDDLKDEMLKKIRKVNSGHINVPIHKTNPQILKKDLNFIEDLMGEYSTTFNSGVKGRSENIRLSSESINNTLLMPEEEFSFNESTGPRSAEAGYKEAPVIINGELVPDIGGGICQVSTTLYQAAVRSDLEVTSRRNHGLPVAYVPLGQDATVAYGYIDFKFKNNNDYPIYIESYVNGNRIHVKIYGQKVSNISIGLESEVTEVVEPKIEVKKDRNMNENERKVLKKSRNGYRVTTYKTYIEEDREIKREVITNDYYPPRDGVIIQGTN